MHKVTHLTERSRKQKAPLDLFYLLAQVWWLPRASSSLMVEVYHQGQNLEFDNFGLAHSALHQMNQKMYHTEACQIVKFHDSVTIERMEVVVE